MKLIALLMLVSCYIAAIVLALVAGTLVSLGNGAFKVAKRLRTI